MYTGKYNNLERFSSYLSQIKTILSLNPKKVLEIGVGNKITSNYLRTEGVQITTCDIDKNLNPDIVADIRELPFNEDDFDLITAFEVLEHIPFSDVESALRQLHRISKKKVIISIPYVTFSIYAKFKLLPFIRSSYFMIRICEYFWHTYKWNGTHHWEMGTKGFSRKKIREVMKTCGFRIEKEFTPELNPYHYFFVLEKIA